MNLVTVTKTNMINEMPCGDGTLRTTGVRMLLQSLRAFYKAPQGGAGSIWKYLEALARATRVSKWFVYGFQTEFAFCWCKNSHQMPQTLPTANSPMY